MPNDIPSFPKRILGYGIMFITAIYPLHPAWSAVITPADKNTQITQQNNVPIINIATPNNIGVSHNKFQNFNVDKQGAVLNNAINNINSQLAGQVKANTILKGHAANLIINEVVGSGRSQLQGVLEVAGKQANVLIANPNGITCNGCGFINTPAITLTTGKPIMDKQGALSAIEVKKGSVIVGGKGMDVQAQSYADIISRATELNGQIKAKNLTLMQGANRVDIQQGTVIPAKGEGQKPSISVDTKALGGMYADQVRLVSTENGVGVNLSNIQTTQNDLTLTVDGKITLAGNIQSKNEINISTKNLQISNNAKLSGQKDITLAANTLNNNGQVIAGKDMRVFADTISNSGDKALIQAKDNLWMQKNAKGDLSTLIENKSATIKTDTGDLLIRSKVLLNDSASPSFTVKSLMPTSTNKNLVIGKVRASNNEYDIEFIATVSPGLPKKWFEKANFSLGLEDMYQDPAIWVNTGQKLITTTSLAKPGEVISGKYLYINSNKVNNYDGLITAKNNLIMTGGMLGNQQRHHYRIYDYLVYQQDKNKTGKTSANGYPIRSMSVEIPYKQSSLASQLTLWENTKYSRGLRAGSNLVLDFTQQITMAPALRQEHKQTTYSNIFHFNPLTAKNIVLKSGQLKVDNYKLVADNITLLGNDVLDVTGSELNAARSLSLLTQENLNLSQSSLLSHDISLIAKNGHVHLKNAGKNLFKNESSPPILNQLTAKNSLLINSGKDIVLDNIKLNKPEKLHVTANGDIQIIRDESVLIKTSLPDSSVSSNALIKKVGVWESLGDMSFSAGGSILSQGIIFKSGQSLTFNAGQDINLASKAIKDVDILFQTNRYPELRSQLIANGNITLNAARDIDLKSALLLSKNNVTVLSGRDMKLTASLYSAIPDSHEDLQDTRYVTTSISGDKGLTLASTLIVQLPLREAH